jgi:hypothetical protein
MFMEGSHPALSIKVGQERRTDRRLLTCCLKKEETMAQAMEMSKKSIDEYTEKLRERDSRMTGRG